MAVIVRALLDWIDSSLSFFHFYHFHLTCSFSFFSFGSYLFVCQENGISPEFRVKVKVVKVSR